MSTGHKVLVSLHRIAHVDQIKAHCRDDCKHGFFKEYVPSEKAYPHRKKAHSQLERPTVHHRQWNIFEHEGLSFSCAEREEDSEQYHMNS